MESNFLVKIEKLRESGVSVDAIAGSLGYKRGAVYSWIRGSYVPVNQKLVNDALDRLLKEQHLV